jgi:hypothetical protein
VKPVPKKSWVLSFFNFMPFSKAELLTQNKIKKPFPIALETVLPA